MFRPSLGLDSGWLLRLRMGKRCPIGSARAIGDT